MFQRNRKKTNAARTSRNRDDEPPGVKLGNSLEEFTDPRRLRCEIRWGYDSLHSGVGEEDSGCVVALGENLDGNGAIALSPTRLGSICDL
jgi:hypothetical protein